MKLAAVHFVRVAAATLATGALLILLSPPAAAHLGTAVVNSPASEIQPDISGSKLVYAAAGSGDYDIYVKDLTTSVTTAITNDTTSQANPAIDGTIMAWEDVKNEGLQSEQIDIFARDLFTGVTRQVTAGAVSQLPAVSGSRIVYQDDRNGNYDVFVYDFSTAVESAVAAGQADAMFPDIQGARVFWADSRTSDFDIYAKDLSTGVETHVVFQPGEQVRPSVSGDILVWQDYRSGNWDIYMKNLATGLESVVSATAAAEQYPRVEGNYILWQADFGITGGDVYLKDLATGLQSVVAATAAPEQSPRVAGTFILWQASSATTGWDIYLALANDPDGDLCAPGSPFCPADNCPAVFNQDQTNTDQVLAAAGARIGIGNPPPVLPSDTLGDACDSDDDNDGFSDVNEQRIYGVSAGSAQELTPCRHDTTVTDPWPVDFYPFGNPDRVVDTREVSFIRGFVGKAPASPGYSVRLDLKTDNPNNPGVAGVIDTGEVSFILGIVGKSCVSP